MSDIRVNSWYHQSGTGGVVQDSSGNIGIGTTSAASSLVVIGDANFGGTGIITATKFSGAFDGTTGSFSGDVSIGGTLTYEDVTNIDSVGLITARSGIKITGGNLEIGSSVGRFDSSGIIKTAHGTESAPSHTFINDPDNGMYRPTTNTLGFVCGGDERLRITSAGKVGIGSDDPQKNLDIYVGQTHGYIRLHNLNNGGTGYDSELSLLGSASNSEMRLNMGVNSDPDREQIKSYQSNLIFTTNTDERLRISSTGLVGIGTITNWSPYKLQVAGGLGIAESANTGQQAMSITNNAIQTLAIGVAYNSLLLNKDGGNVSIGGNTSVGTKLHIENSSGDAHIRLRGSANYGVLFTRHSDAALLGFIGSGGAVNLGSSNLGITAGLSGGNIVFQTGGTAAGDERVRITSDGNVGINQTNPNKAKLHVVADSGSTDKIVAKFRNPQGSADVKAKIGFAAGYSDTANDTEGQAYIGAQREGSGNNAALFFETSDGSTVTERLRITSAGIVKFKDNGAAYTNTLQSYTTEAGYITHYTARTTSGSDRYRRMLDIASIGGNPHGSSIRFLTSNDSSNPATGHERMRIMHGNGVLIQDEGSLSHNQNYPHRSCPGLLTVHNGEGESNRTDTSTGVYAPPTGGFVNYADYELAAKLITISNSNCNIIMAKNGEPIVINDGRDSWGSNCYNKLPNYLVGLPCTDCINNTDFTLTLYADFLVFLLRNNGWNSIGTGVDNFPTGWREIEANTNIEPPGVNTRLYCKSVSAGTYNNWDNNSAMYFFRLA